MCLKNKSQIFKSFAYLEVKDEDLNELIPLLPK